MTITQAIVPMDEYESLVRGRRELTDLRVRLSVGGEWDPAQIVIYRSALRQIRDRLKRDVGIPTGAARDDDALWQQVYGTVCDAYDMVLAALDQGQKTQSGGQK